MIRPLISAFACRWLVEPTLVVVVLGLAVASATAGWLWGRGSGGDHAAPPARLAGLFARLGMLAWLGGAVAGLSWRTDDAPSGRPALVLDATLSLPPVAWPGDGVVVDLDVTVSGLDASDLSVEAILREPRGGANRSIKLTPVDATASSLPSRKSPISPSAIVHRFRGRVVPDAAGRHDVSARVLANVEGRTLPPLLRSETIDVMERPVSVLMIDSRPRLETRFLDNTLSRDARIDHVIHLQSSTGAAGEGDGDASPLPSSREEWNRHDCVVLGDVDPSRTDDDAWSTLVEAVSRDGLGVVWAIDGRCDLEAIRTSPLRRLAPVAGLPRAVGESAGKPMILEPPAATAASTPWWLAWRADDESGTDGWPPLAPAYDVFHPTRTSPTARVVVRFEGPENPPAILEDRLGKGRIVAFLSETWRWRGAIAVADDPAAAIMNAARVDAIWRRVILSVSAPHLASSDTVSPAADDDPGVGDASRPTADSAASTPDGPRVLPSREDRVATSSAWAIWSHPLAVAAFLVIASFEWWLRAKGGLV